MRKVIMYIAMSLDGYIADANGGVQWLTGEDPEQGDMGSYPEFIETVDTVVMGYRTYHQIVTELSPGKWLYRGKTSYVVTHKQEESDGEIILTNENPAGLIERLRQQEGKDIWICGGADIVNQLLEASLIDRFHITVIPTLLGDGVRLFEKHAGIIKLHLVSTQCYGGMTDLIYERNR